MKIRQENQSDYETVYKVVQEAFSTAEQSDGNEHELVSALRNSKSFILVHRSINFLSVEANDADY